MDKVLFGKVIAFTIADAFDCLHAMLLVFHDLFKAEELIFTKNDQSQDFNILNRISVYSAIEGTDLAASRDFLKHHLTSGTS